MDIFQNSHILSYHHHQGSVAVVRSTYDVAIRPHNSIREIELCHQILEELKSPSATDELAVHQLFSLVGSLDVAQRKILERCDVQNLAFYFSRQLRQLIFDYFRG